MLNPALGVVERYWWLLTKLPYLIQDDVEDIHEDYEELMRQMPI